MMPQLWLRPASIAMNSRLVLNADTDEPHSKTVSLDPPDPITNDRVTSAAAL